MTENPLKTSAYCRRLAIVDHIRECLQKYDTYKAIESDISSLRNFSKKVLDRELMDLYILLEWEFDTQEGMKLMRQRLDRFEEKFRAEREGR